ncbi:thermonuclease family protein [Kaistia dalseonensis]|uniref:Endonuclease YncB(Thermonuclease family) n=1 Tax=Kaistia dalseonensis TaxID=410840 RepID=A0ABU0HCA7_9HYPH|nr:thermonuclease family protein [Kaistia dalseonensis]MCX5497304.1 thermonuclease family protein [Kaistia dalseonensis]MDQ0439941.1 endonuclease YncB(thermonuclease family) [Kaistia dalseonensis]
MKSTFHALLVAAALCLGSGAALALDGLRVVDGDTVRLGAERIRLIGLDAPELHGKCREEKRLAERARDRLTALLATDDVEIIRSARLDKYRRTLAIVRADGVDVARVLIAEGLARPYHGERRQSWCARVAP